MFGAVNKIENKFAFSTWFKIAETDSPCGPLRLYSVIEQYLSSIGLIFKLLPLVLLQFCLGQPISSDASGQSGSVSHRKLSIAVNIH